MKKESPQEPKITLIIYLISLVLPIWYTEKYICFLYRENTHKDAFIYLFRDYGNVWLMGHLWLEGQIKTIFNPMLYYKHTTDIFMNMKTLYTWSYPPTMAMLSLPFGILPISIGYCLYMGAGIGLTWIALSKLNLKENIKFACILGPASLENIFDGQNGYFTTAFLLFVIYYSLQQKQKISGIWSALLTVKPQIGIIIPIIYLIQKQWKSIITATFGTIALIGISLILFHKIAWIGFIKSVMPFMKITLYKAFITHRPEFYTTMMASPFSIARYFHASISAAYAVDGFFAIIALIATGYAWKHKEHIQTTTLISLTLCAALCISPYSLIYDLIPAQIALVLMLFYPENPLTLVRKYFLYITWIAMSMTTTMYLIKGPPIAGFIPSLLVLVLFYDIIQKIKNQNININ